MGQEIERKFLVRKLPEALEHFPHGDIEQGYLAIGAGGREVRLRIDGEKLLLTAKKGEGQVRDEVEIALTREQFEQLWPLTAGRRISKTRYKIPLDHLTVELDVFRGLHARLAVVEVEFRNEEMCGKFQAPDWFGDEVSGDPRYSNRKLACE